MASTVEARARARERAIAAERVWYACLSLLAVLVFAVATVTAASSQPRTCGLCHGDVQNGLAKSGHAKVSCDQCHTGTNGFDVLTARLGVTSMVVAKISPPPTKVQPQIDSRRCLVCHAADIAGTVTVGGLRMNHHAPTAAGWSCQTCHPESGHRATAAAYSMDMCMSCHSSDPHNINTCGVCHADKGVTSTSTRPRTSSPWNVTHGENWQKTHGMGDLTTCKGCDIPGFCNACHVRNVPHPGGYIQLHGQDVLTRADGSKACMRCHQEGACLACHGMPMPHGKDWVQIHPGVTKKSDRSLCMRCHAQSSCDDCHIRHTHPGIDRSILKDLRSNMVKQP